MISVVSPFYNEEQILDVAVRSMLAKLQQLPHEWEYIIVNDGSRDSSGKIAHVLAEEFSDRLRVVGYERNQGRGFALRTGIEAACGDVIITTECDLSWGEDIVERLFAAIDADPSADVVTASPNSSKGGQYRNIPMYRVLLSKFGNKLLSLALTDRVSMYTGMTRAYRADVIKGIPLHENGKEFHLESLVKLLALGFNIIEIPCVLEWKKYKGAHAKGGAERKSKTNVSKLIGSHLLFAFLARPIRYIWAVSTIIMLAGLILGCGSVIRFAMGELAYHWGIAAGVLVLLSTIFFVFGIVAQQNTDIQLNLWRIEGLLAGRRPQRGQAAAGAMNDRDK